MSESEIEIRRGLTMRSFVIGLALMIFFTIFGTIQTYFSGSFGGELNFIEADWTWPENFGFGHGNPGWLIITPFLAIAVINALLPQRMKFTAQELTLILVMMITGGLSPLWAEMAGPQNAVWFEASEGGKSQFGGLLNPLLWKAPLLYVGWGLFLILGLSSIIFLNLMFRKQMILVERLSFPKTTVPLTLVETSTSSERRIFNKLLWIGILIGFLWELPSLLTYLWPTIFSDPATRMQYDATAQFQTVWPVASWLIRYDIKEIAFWFMWPMDVLLSTWIFNLIIGKILPTVGNYLNIGTFDYYGDGTVFPPFANMRSFWADGALLGLGLIPLVFKWRSIVETFKNAFGKSRTKERSISDLIILVGFIISTLGMYLWMVFLGADPIPVLVLLFFALITSLGLSRAHGEGHISVGVEVWPHGAWDSMVNITLYKNGAINQGSLTTFTFFNSILGSRSMPNFCGSGAWILMSLRMADQTKTRWRDILLVGVPGTIVSMVVASWLYYYFMSIYGWKGPYWEGPGIVAAQLNALGTGMVWARPNLYFVAAGAIFTIILHYLHIRFTWFPLNPVGFLLGGTPGTLYYGRGFLGISFWAWLLKYGVLKIGGGRMYSKVLSIAVGIILGATIPFWAIEIKEFYSNFILQPVPGEFPVP